LPQLSGQVHKDGKLRIGYFAQFQTDELDVTLTPYEVMKNVMKTAPESKVRAALSKFGFDKHKADTLVGEISGGEKARLLFCLMSHDAPHIMLLDEPTNHLDIDAREALTQALNNYTGAVILVSHDPHLVDAVVNRLWLVADGTCKPYDDDLEGYRKLIVNQRKREREEAKKEARSNKKSKSEKTANPEKEMDKLEQKVLELIARRDATENDIANACEGNDTALIKRLEKTHAEITQELANAQKAWEDSIAEL
jgi:ATP-binding cassette subfamily F protein 3